MKIKILIVACILLLPSYCMAKSFTGADMCDLMPNLLGGSVSTTGTGEGCSWNIAEGQKMSAYVHYEMLKETVVSYKSMMDSGVAMPSTRSGFPLCGQGEIYIVDVGNGDGPSGLAYAQCPDRVIGFTFNGQEGLNNLKILAEKLK
jgi:hypothetical protein